jgi:glycerate-2-kinase
VNRALLASGAPIGEMNCIRKHLSAFSGGGWRRRRTRRGW